MTYKLLIIDDHPETLDIISRVLRQQGYAVIPAAAAVEGLSLAESEKPDLILLDGMMPEMDGWEVCRRIRANETIANTPIIMFSAVNKAEQKLAGFEAGADDYLTKPTEPVELAERVKALLDGVQPRHQINSDELKAFAELEPAQRASSKNMTMALAAENNLIAVLGVRGGAGTTTLALNLASCLAQTEKDTVLVDLDETQGHVGLYLNQKSSDGLNQLARLPEGMVGGDVSKRLTKYNDHLQLLLTEPNLLTESDTPSPQQVLEIFETLTQPGRFVVVDCGQGVTAVNRPVIEQADQILVCIRPERVALASAKQFLPQLQETLFPHTQLHSILLDFKNQTSVPRQAIEGFLGYPLAAVITMKPQDLSRAVNKSIPFVQANPEAQATALIAQLAQQVVKE